MAKVTQQHIRKQLQQYQDPYTQQALPEKAIRNISINDKQIELDITMGYPVVGVIHELQAGIKDCLSKIMLTTELMINITSEIVGHATQSTVKAIPKVRNIIAVASGKGGVGKSTTVINLAAALSQMHARVGLLDGDIYGPNQPLMMGLQEYSKPKMTPEKKLIPHEHYGIKCMSMGFLVAADTPMVWRGPMVSSALQQLAHDTDWGELDYLFVDLPPGTGDIQLTLAKKIPVSGALIVTTPQEVALMDARKAIAMFNKVQVKILGLIENMTHYHCPACGHKETIFGDKGAASICEHDKLPLLGHLPLASSIRQDCDTGKPTVLTDSDQNVAAQYKTIARRMAAQLSLQPKNYGAHFPNIVVE